MRRVFCDYLDRVMAGLVPAIHVLFAAQETWMPGTSPGMTVRFSAAKS